LLVQQVEVSVSLQHQVLAVVGSALYVQFLLLPLPLLLLLLAAAVVAAVLVHRQQPKLCINTVSAQQRQRIV
jgi:NADH:ubiquinone oxidoreductase subunit 6 (subunit J)